MAPPLPSRHHPLGFADAAFAFENTYIEGHGSDDGALAYESRGVAAGTLPAVPLGDLQPAQELNLIDLALSRRYGPDPSPAAVACTASAVVPPMPPSTLQRYYSDPPPSCTQPPDWPTCASYVTPSPRLRPPGAVEEPASSGSRSSPTPSVGAAHPRPSASPKHSGSCGRRQREPHNVVERRYRENLNGQLESLRSCLLSRTQESWTSGDTAEPAIHAKTASKAEVIAAAHSYIRTLESQKARLLEENVLLNQQVEGLQKIVQCDDRAVLDYLGAVSLQQPFHAMSAAR